MTGITHPLHTHGHRLWIVPDSPLGVAAIVTFAASLVVLFLAIALRVPYLDMLGATSDTGWDLFWKLLPPALALVVGAVSSVLAFAAMVHDHALALLVPATLGLLMGMVALAEVIVPH
jgi:hypothetical protein